MKKLIFVLIIFASCEIEEKPSLTSIEVVESVTNLPVRDATLSLYRCNFGCPFGPNVLFTSVTDANGICQVPSENYTDVESMMYVAKEKYWPFEVQKKTIVFLEPEGWLQLRILNGDNYPLGSRLLLDLYSQSGSRSDLTDYNTVMDSLVLIRGFGSQQNKIDWQVVDGGYNLIKNGTLNGLQIPRFDTLKNVTLNY